MKHFCQYSDLILNEEPITSWEDSILTPKNQNIVAINHQKHVNKPYHRRQNFINKQKIKEQV